MDLKMLPSFLGKKKGILESRQSANACERRKHGPLLIDVVDPDSLIGYLRQRWYAPFSEIA